MRIADLVLIWQRSSDRSFAPYLKAAELLNVRKPLVVEDSDAGAAAGHAAGFDVLRIAHPDELASKLRNLLVLVT